jgi:hypothetical protein
MATTKSRSTSTRAKSSGTKRTTTAKRSVSQRASNLVSKAEKRPYATAAIATGAVAAVAAAAAGAFFFSRRDKSFSEATDELGEKLSGYGDRIKDGLGEARDKASAFFNRDVRDQSDIAEEAETLKGTGDMLDNQSKRATKAGAVAY